MKTRPVRKGNSRGVRLPKPSAKTTSFAQKRPRASWAEAARALHAKNGDRLIGKPTPTRFEEDEWQW
jgi:antitoxin component of MazEF toxin-antitoxin module